jgi:hypothetical protein
MPRVIPERVPYTEFLAAGKPLLDLCGVTANEIQTDIHITGTGRGASSLARITFDVVVLSEESADLARPKSVPVAGFQSNSELTVHCVVEAH